MQSWTTLDQWRADAPDVHAGEAAAVAEATAAAGVLPGQCDACGATSGFIVPGAGTSLREGLHCHTCGCNARQRAATRLLLDGLQVPMRARVAITEQASRLFLALRRQVGDLQGSEYLTTLKQWLRVTLWLWRHGIAGRARHGDVTAMAHTDGSLDGILSLDVLEHVPDHRAALNEFVRVLRPGGVLVLTVPFHEMQAGNERIAEFDGEGRIRHHGEPEYHGDPLSGGVLCFHHFGWALLDEMRAAGFRTVQACRVQDAACGLPQGQWVIRARR